jgi:HAD superfamily hydrolase (TIGR01509 family)
MKKIKAILFDLDGVLCHTKMIHYEALNKALGDYSISFSDHINKYDGLKTNEKLKKLTQEKALPQELHKKIWNNKQHFTIELLNNLQPDQQIIDCIKQLSLSGYKIACCSNSIAKTIYFILFKLNIIQYFDLILSNEEVTQAKPHPEIYWKGMSILNVLPDETLIIEDSPAGLLAAEKSSANVLRVTGPKEVTYINIMNSIKNAKTIKAKWVSNKMNVLIPMSGAGSRFEKAGFIFPKPLIDINGKPMIQAVVENLNIEANYIYIVQKKHREKYNLDSVLNIITPNCTIIEVDGLTEGAACSALLAKEFINNDKPLFFANSDQFVEWSSLEFMYKMQETNTDCGIVIFESTHPKWSFVKINEDDIVTEVAEKNPISNNATVGYYYWKKGSDFVKYAEQMIAKNIRVNNEFYVCPVFNEAIQDGKIVKPFKIEKMWGLGTPEDLQNFLSNYNN